MTQNDMVPAEYGSYANPLPYEDGIPHTAPDPFVMEYRGRYYCYATDVQGVTVSVSDDLTRWDRLGYAYVEEGRHNYWAPSVIVLDGVFYLYVSNTPVDSEDPHQEMLRVAVSDTPTGPFELRKVLFDAFAIDSQVVKTADGRLYLLYADNQVKGSSDIRPGTSVMADRLIDPFTLRGEPVTLIAPTLDREIFARNRFGDGRDWHTVEGGTYFTHRDRAFITYSGNAYEHEDYFVGYSAANLPADARTFADDMAHIHLDELDWRKQLDSGNGIAVLQKSDVVEGTGHNSIVRAPNDIDDWIVYHGRDIADGRTDEEQRIMRMDPVFYCEDGLDVDGPSHEERTAPAAPDLADMFADGLPSYQWTILEGCAVCDDAMMRCDASSPFFGLFRQDRRFDCCRMSVWARGPVGAMGCVFGFAARYTDERNATFVEVDAGLSRLRIVERTNAVSVELASRDLHGLGIDLSQWHRYRIDRAYGRIDVRIDDMEVLSIATASVSESGCVGVFARNAGACFSALRVTEHVDLWGDRLADIAHEVDEDGGAVALRDGEIEPANTLPAALRLVSPLPGMRMIIDGALERDSGSLTLSIGDIRFVMGWDHEFLTVRGRDVQPIRSRGSNEGIRFDERGRALKTAAISCDSAGVHIRSRGRTWFVDTPVDADARLSCILDQAAILGYSRTSLGRKKEDR